MIEVRMSGDKQGLVKLVKGMAGGHQRKRR